MDIAQFCSSSRVVIVAGKGGVGKTTYTATLATVAARAGLRVLIVEVEQRAGLSALFGLGPLGPQRNELAPNIDAITVTPDQALLEYLDTRGLRAVSRRLASSGVLDVVSTAIPGIKDLLVLGKIKHLEQTDSADLIIVDAPAAGHAITFLLSATGMSDAVVAGVINAQAEDIASMLSDQQRCQVTLVSLPEHTPVNELIETAFTIEERARIALSPLVINGIWPDTEQTGEHIADDAAKLGILVTTSERNELRDALTFRRTRAELHALEISRLQSELPLQQLKLPFVFSPEIEKKSVGLLASALAREIEMVPA